MRLRNRTAVSLPSSRGAVAPALGEHVQANLKLAQRQIETLKAQRNSAANLAFKFGNGTDFFPSIANFFSLVISGLRMAETVKTPLRMTAREFVTAIALMAGAAC